MVKTLCPVSAVVSLPVSSWFTAGSDHTVTAVQAGATLCWASVIMESVLGDSASLKFGGLPGNVMLLRVVCSQNDQPLMFLCVGL